MKILGLIFCALLLSAADAPKTAPAPIAKTVPWEKNHLQIGEELYRNNCQVCHDIDQPQQGPPKKYGPNFYHLFSKPKMPLAPQPPNRAYIAFKIRLGGSFMPAFMKKLSPAEIDTIIDYMQSK